MSDPIPKLRQLKSTLCWAACIEMVAKSMNAAGRGSEPVLQTILRAYYANKRLSAKKRKTLIDDFCVIGRDGMIGQDGYPTIAKSKTKAIPEIFRNTFGIECQHKVLTRKMPDFSFLKDRMASGSRVVLGLKYPGLVAGQHLVVVVRCVPLGEIKLLAVHDPSNPAYGTTNCDSEGGVLAYWNYSELCADNAGNNYICFISGFQRPLPRTIPAETISANLFWNLDEIGNKVKSWINEMALFGGDESLDANTRRAFSSLSITRDDFINEAWNAGSSQILIPIYVSARKKYEIVLAPRDRGAVNFRFLGFRETVYPDLQDVKTVKIRKANGSTEIIDVDHDEPNFSLVHIQPMDMVFMKFEIADGDFVTTAYVSPYKIPRFGASPGDSFSYDKLRELFEHSF